MLNTDSESKVTKIVIKDRLEFISLAKEKRMSLVPCYCFGEKWTNKTINIRPEFLKTLFLSLGVGRSGFIGRYCSLLPMNNKPLGWVFGEPINTSNDSVEELHRKFILKTKEIFDKYKKYFEYMDDETIEFISAK
jgi:hypothetical protein